MKVLHGNSMLVKSAIKLNAATYIYFHSPGLSFGKQDTQQTTDRVTNRFALRVNYTLYNLKRWC